MSAVKTMYQCTDDTLHESQAEANKHQLREDIRQCIADSTYIQAYTMDKILDALMERFNVNHKEPLE